MLVLNNTGSFLEKDADFLLKDNSTEFQLIVTLPPELENEDLNWELQSSSSNSTNDRRLLPNPKPKQSPGNIFNKQPTKGVHPKVMLKRESTASPSPAIPSPANHSFK